MSLKKTLTTAVLTIALISAAFIPTIEGANYFSEYKTSGDTVPILMYHSITGDESEAGGIVISLKALDAQFSWLRENGYTALLPSELNKVKEVSNPVIITFDDGYADNYQYLPPLLEKYDLKAEINIIVKNVEEDYQFFMDWEELKELVDSGRVEIGSHTYNLHNPETAGGQSASGRNGVQSLRSESKKDFEKRVRSDLEQSIELIEKRLGVRPVVFAYPYGAKDLRSSALVKELFEISLLTKPGYAYIRSGSHNLNRYPVTETTDLSDLLQ